MRSRGFLLGSIILSAILVSTVVFGMREFGITAETNVNDNGDSGENIDSIILMKIDLLIKKVENSSDDCWKDPVGEMKSEIINKSIEIKELIILGCYNKAYNKLLHEIKPKLTGLNTDENEIVWGDGIFYNPWILCEELKEEFRVDCNELLTLIKVLIIKLI